MSQVAFLGLFTLISATMYQIDQSLKFLLPFVFKISEEKARRNVKIYNWSIISLLLVFTGLFFYIFYTPDDVGRNRVLWINLTFRLLFLIVYVVTVCRLYRKFKYFPSGVMDSEVKSIKRQFLAFMIGFIVQCAFFAYEI